jgi:hypothetical protein
LFFLTLLYVLFIVRVFKLWILAKFTVAQVLQPCEGFFADLPELDCGAIVRVG